MMKFSLNRDARGVSEVIGALMLVLVVVIAASALAVFISEKQKDIQDQDRIETERDLESIKTTWILPSGTSGTLWEYVEIELSSLHLKESSITRLAINGAYIFTAVMYNVSSLSFDIPVSFISPLDFDSLEVILLNVSLQDANFYGSKPNIEERDYIRIDVHTELLNTFTKFFQPPTSIIKINTDSQWDPSTLSYIGVIVLDGSDSDHPGEDSYIIAWEWIVEGDDDGDGTYAESGEESFTLSGRIVRVDGNFTAPAGSNHLITLKVIDNFGMRSTSSIIYNY